MFWDYVLDVIHATVANLNCVSVENFVQFVASGKVCVHEVEKFACDVCLNVFLFLLNGGLNQMILRCLFLRDWCVTCGMYSSLCAKLLCPSAFWYVCAASWKVSLSDDSVEMRLLIETGSCLRILGGWVGGWNVCVCITDRHWASYKVYVFQMWGRK